MNRRLLEAAVLVGALALWGAPLRAQTNNLIEELVGGTWIPGNNGGNHPLGVGGVTVVNVGGTDYFYWEHAGKQFRIQRTRVQNAKPPRDRARKLIQRAIDLGLKCKFYFKAGQIESVEISAR